MENISLSNALLLQELGLDGASFSDNYSFSDFLDVALEYQQHDHWFNAKEEVALVLSFSLVMLIGVVANLGLWWIICRRGFAQSSRNWYILNLAISDVLTIVLCKPFVVVRIISKNWTFGVAWCKIVPLLQSTYVFVSTLSILALAVDRYKSIMYTAGKSNNRIRTCLIISGIWMVSVALSFPLLLAHEVKILQGLKNFDLYTICTEHWGYQILLTVYTVMVLLIQYLSPAVAIVTLHILICKSLKYRLDLHETCQQDVSRIRNKLLRHRKNVMLLTSMAISFSATWLPLTLLNILADTNHIIFQQTNFPLIHAVCLLISFSSVCINPVIYGWFNSNFRKDIRNICDVTSLRTCSLYAFFCRQNLPRVDNSSFMYSAAPRENTRFSPPRTSHDVTVV